MGRLWQPVWESGYENASCHKRVARKQLARKYSNCESTMPRSSTLHSSKSEVPGAIVIWNTLAMNNSYILD